MIKERIIKELREVLESLGWHGLEVVLEHPAGSEHGDYATGVALKCKVQPIRPARGRSAKCEVATQKLKTEDPYELALVIAEKMREKRLIEVEKTEVAKPGFINFWLSKDYLVGQLAEVLGGGEGFGVGKGMTGKKIMVEYAHPNTHKEMHIGHMRTLITGEALARILKACGAGVFRANYQGDIGPHVAKAIYGTRLLFSERGMTFGEAEKLGSKEKAHLLGEGYVRGSRDYEENPEKKEEIDILNDLLYQKDPLVLADYERTRKWSLDYYDELYKRFYTKFDQLFFESEVFEEGKRLVLANMPGIFEESEGAVVFPGEKYGLHRRVFITHDGNATYEGKDMALAKEQFRAFPFDLNIHVVANEQQDYFRVIIKALELLDPKFRDREYHLSMGMVNLVGVKMSSRTGQFITVDGLLDKVKELVFALIKKDGLSSAEVEEIMEKVTVGAVKYSVLGVDPTMNVVFDFEKSVSLNGDSGPYLQYTYARIQSVIKKFKVQPIRPVQGRSAKCKVEVQNSKFGSNYNEEEMEVLRSLYRFPEVVAEAGRSFKPNLVGNYLFGLAQKFNSFYDKHSILGESYRQQTTPRLRSGQANNKQQGVSEGVREFRVALTAAVGEIIKNGLFLLGIEAPERM